MLFSLVKYGNARVHVDYHLQKISRNTIDIVTGEKEKYGMSLIVLSKMSK